jgi:hypothetical protein
LGMSYVHRKWEQWGVLHRVNESKPNQNYLAQGTSSSSCWVSVIKAAAVWHLPKSYKYYGIWTHNHL